MTDSKILLADLVVLRVPGYVFSLKTPRDLFGSTEHGESEETPWPLGLAVATLAAVTVVVALVSEVFVESVQGASVELGMTPAFVGFIVVALVGAAAEMASAFSGAWKNRLDLSVGIALFVAPVLVLLSYVLGPSPLPLGRTRYELTVLNAEGRCREVRVAELDGMAVDFRAIPLVDDGEVHRVLVRLGAS